MIRRVSAFLALLIATVMIVGCGAEAVTQGGTPRPKQYRRVVSLSPSTSEILSLYDPTMVVGRTSSCDWPEGSFANAKVVADVKPNYEAIAELKPELIVYDANLFSAADVDKLKATAGNAELLPFDATTVTGLQDWITKLGTRVGGESFFSEYNDRIYGEISQAQATAVKGVKIAIVTGDATSGYYVAGTDSFQADVIRQVGGEPVGPKAKNFGLMGAEALTAAAPDLIVTSGNASALLKDPKLAAIPAVKNGRVRGIRGDVLLRAGARVHLLIEGMTALTRGAK